MIERAFYLISSPYQYIFKNSLILRAQYWPDRVMFKSSVVVRRCYTIFSFIKRIIGGYIVVGFEVPTAKQTIFSVTGTVMQQTPQRTSTRIFLSTAPATQTGNQHISTKYGMHSSHLSVFLRVSVLGWRTQPTRLELIITCHQKQPRCLYLIFSFNI